MRCVRLVIPALILGLAAPPAASIQVNPTGVNVSAQGATTVFLTFGGLRPDQLPAEAFWCGELVAAAPDVGLRCDDATLFGRLPLRYDRSSVAKGMLTDVMSIPPSVARRAFQAAEAGQLASFFYVRRFVSDGGLPDEYVAVTCRLTAGGARVPLSLTDVRYLFDAESPLPVLRAGQSVPRFRARITYTGTGWLRGRWEVVLPGEDPPADVDMLPEGALPRERRGHQRRYTQLERFDRYLDPGGLIDLAGPDPAHIPTSTEGAYRILLRIEASDDREADSDPAAAGGAGAVLHSGGLAGFPLPVLRYTVAGGDPSPAAEATDLMLASPATDAALSPAKRAEFAWSAHPGTWFYRLEIRGAGGPDVAGAVVRGDRTAWRAPPWLPEKAAGATLRWRVLALGANGSELARTPWREFRFEETASAP